MDTPSTLPCPSNPLMHMKNHWYPAFAFCWLRCTFLYLMLIAVSSSVVHAQHNWTGVIDSVYENPGNWDQNTVPGIQTDVIIPFGTPHKVVITTATAVARTIDCHEILKIKSGAKLTVNEGNGSGRLGGDAMHIGYELQIDSTGTVEVTQAADTAIVIKGGTIINRGIMQIEGANCAIYGTDIFTQCNNYGQIKGSAGIRFEVGRFTNFFPGYVAMAGEIRMTGANSRNDCIMVVSSADSLVLEENFFGALVHNAGQGGIRLLNNNGRVLQDTALYWTGLQDTSWNNPGNWILDRIPANDDYVVFPKDFFSIPTLTSGHAIIRHLFLESSSQLIIASGSSLTINNDSDSTSLVNQGVLRNFGTFTVQTLNTTKALINDHDAAFQNQPGSMLLIDGGLSGLENGPGSSSFNNEGLIRISNVSGPTALENKGLASFNNFLCGHINMQSQSAILDPANAFFNSGSILLNSTSNSSIHQHSSLGIIHNLGTGSIAVNVSNGPIFSSPAVNIWRGCTDAQWEEANNWSRLRIPMLGDSVLLSNYNDSICLNSITPAIKYLENYHHNLIVKGGAKLLLDPGPLEPSLVGNIINAGKMTVHEDAFISIAHTEAGTRYFVNSDSVINHGNISLQNTQYSNESFGYTNNKGSLTISNNNLSNFTGRFENQGSINITVLDFRTALVNNSSSTFNNQGKINLNSNLSASAALSCNSNSTFNNESCSSLTVNQSIEVDNSTLFNAGLINYISSTSNLGGGTFTDSGYQYDPTNALPNGPGTVIVPTQITHEQFIADNDGDGVAFCSGDLDDICQILNPTFAVTNTNDDGPGSLRRAIRDACPGAEIECYLTLSDTIKLDSSIIIAKDVVLRGGINQRTIISGVNGDFSLFNLNSSANLSVFDCTFLHGGGDTTQTGGSIDAFSGTNGNENVLKLINCHFYSNHVNLQGGAISTHSDSCKMYNSIFMENRAESYGGALDIQQSYYLIAQSLFGMNSCSSAGGAINLLLSQGHVNQSSLISNMSGDVGGAVEVNQASIEIANALFSDNHATSQGSDIFKDFGSAIEANHSFFQDLSGSGLTAGTNDIITGNPMLNSTGTGFEIFNLLPGSPCQNTGSNSKIPGDECDLDKDDDLLEPIGMDLNDKPRIQDKTVDIGAFELTNETCTQAFQVYCGDIIKGDNLWASNTTFQISDCTTSGTSPYLGTLWYVFHGTGDSIRVQATATRNDAINLVDLQVYEDAESGCPGPCLGGFLDIDTGPADISFLTEVGKSYLFMIGNYVEGSSVPNIDSFHLSISCICLDRALTLAPPLNFNSGDQYSAQTDLTIQASNMIEGGASVQYNAMQGTTLQPNFSVTAGANFEISTDGCDVPVLRPLIQPTRHLIQNSVLQNRRRLSGN